MKLNLKKENIIYLQRSTVVWGEEKKFLWILWAVLVSVVYLMSPYKCISCGSDNPNQSLLN